MALHNFIGVVLSVAKTYRLHTYEKRYICENKYHFASVPHRNKRIDCVIMTAGIRNTTTSPATNSS